MIYTQYGSEVEILSGKLITCKVEIRYIEQGHVTTTTINQLKADGGIKEIVNAIIATQEG